MRTGDRSVAFMISMPGSVRDELDRIAQEDTRTRSNMILKIVSEYLERLRAGSDECAATGK